MAHRGKTIAVSTVVFGLVIMKRIASRGQLMRRNRNMALTKWP
jgi:hypothetical protein